MAYPPIYPTVINLITVTTLYSVYLCFKPVTLQSTNKKWSELSFSGCTCNLISLVNLFCFLCPLLCLEMFSSSPHYTVTVIGIPALVFGNYSKPFLASFHKTETLTAKRFWVTCIFKGKMYLQYRCLIN